MSPEEHEKEQRRLLGLHGHEDLKTPEDREKVARTFAKDVVKMVQDYRKAHGMPPMPEE